MTVAIVTLTTDFGVRDPYVAEMKAAVLGITTSVQLVDVTHEVQRHDITEAALALEAAVPFFPPGTIHVAVVDPGVGTDRRGIAVESAGHIFIGPDNGLFTPFVSDPAFRAFELRSEEYRLPIVSRTFHGRDIFAPAAGHVARGLPPTRLGPPITDPVKLPWPEVREVAGTVAGAVVHVDRFGNLVTSIHGEAVKALGPNAAIRIAGRPVPLVTTYADLATGRVGALLGSQNRLEVAVREVSAAALLRARRGTPVLVSRRFPASTRRRLRKD